VLYVLSGDNIRFPKLDELYRSRFTEPGVFQDCTLVPERNVSFELGINGTGYSQGTWGFLDKVEYAFSYFNNRYENKIFEVYAMKKDPTPVNSVNTSEIYGVDFTLTATTLHGALEIQGGYMLLDISHIRVFKTNRNTGTSFNSASIPGKPDTGFACFWKDVKVIITARQKALFIRVNWKDVRMWMCTSAGILKQAL